MITLHMISDFSQVGLFMKCLQFLYDKNVSFKVSLVDYKTRVQVNFVLADKKHLF